jgi:glutamine synthetase
MSFDGSAIDGFSRVQESDVLALTATPPPSRSCRGLRGPECAPRVFCDIVDLDGSAPSRAVPASGCVASLKAPAVDGFTFFVSPEVEYFYSDALRPGRGARPPLDGGSYFDLLPSTISAAESVARRCSLSKRWASGVEHAQHEDAPSQHEIDLRYTDALSHGRHRHDRCATSSRSSHARPAWPPASCPSPSRRRAGLGHAHHLLAVARRGQRLRRPRRPRTV